MDDKSPQPAGGPPSTPVANRPTPPPNRGIPRPGATARKTSVGGETTAVKESGASIGNASAAVATIRSIELRQTLSFWQFFQLRRRLNATSRERSPKDAESRRAAIRDAVDSKDLRVVPLLIQLLSDEWVIVRESAAHGLGKLQATDATDRLKELVATDPNADVRRAAGLALGNIGALQAIPSLLTLADAQPRFRTILVDTITRLGTPAIPHLLQSLVDSPLPICLISVSILGKLADKSAVKPLLKLFKTAEGPLKANIAEALGAIGDPLAVGPLLALLSDPNSDIVLASLGALTRLANSDCVDAISKFLSHPVSQFRGLAASGLGKIGSARTVSSLTKLLDDSDEDVRRRAAEALGQIETPAAVRPLINALHDPAPAVRQEAAEALGMQGDPKAALPLAAALNDDYQGVRKACAEALGALGDPVAVPALSRFLELEHVAETRLAGIRSLGQIGDPTGLPILQFLLRLDSATRCRACVAIAQIRSPAALEQLIQLRGDATPEVRYHAAIGLGNSGEPRALKALEEMLNDADPFVLRGVARALEQFSGSHARDLIAKAQIRQDRLKDAKKTAEITAPSPTSTSVAGRNIGMSRLLELAQDRRIQIAVPALLLVFVVGYIFWPTGTPPVGRRAPVTQDTAARTRGTVVGVEFSKGTSAICVTSSGMLELWEVGKSQRLREICRIASGATGLALSPQGDLAAVAGGDAAIHLVNLQTGTEIGVLKGHRGSVRMLQFNEDGQKLCSAGSDRQILLWNVAAKGAEWRAVVEGNDAVNAFAADGKLTRVAYGSRLGQITVLEVGSQKKVANIPAFGTAVVAVRFSPDGRQLAAAEGGGEVRTWDLAHRRRLNEFQVPGGAIQMLTFNAKGGLLLAAKASGVDILDLDTKSIRSLEARIERHGVKTTLEQVDCVAIDAAGQFAVACGQSNNEMCAWKLLDGSQLPNLLPKAN
ncbi:MAG: HEAT repeat domain-containing protein [Planctomycetota bacterium]|nr:HEAT repeat domain-containing protein [Planctomycetota bacterium]